MERRRYIRLNSVFPVEFSLYFTPTRPMPQEYQGFTRNISEAGLCLTARNLRAEDERLILEKRVGLSLKINIPLSAKPAQANTEIIWTKKDEDDPSQKTLLIGVSYKEIRPKDRSKIVNYARRLKWMPRLASAAILLFFLGLLTLSFYHLKAKRENQALIKQLVSVSEVKAGLEKELNETRVRKEMLESKLLAGRKEIESLKGEISGIETATDSERDRLAKELDRTLAEHKALEQSLARLSAEGKPAADTVQKDSGTMLAGVKDRIDALQMALAEVSKKGKSQVEILQARLQELQEENNSFREQIELAKEGEISLEEQLAKIKARSGELEEASVEKMLQWIRVHQTRRTGLILSYEGDKLLRDWAFTYDQALACQVFLIYGETERAQSILDFYKNKARRFKGLFYNAYDVKTGSPCEYTVHSGPNIWIGISACRYIRDTDDKNYLSLAEGIADRIIQMQEGSEDGSIKGGPDTEWVSTEHNLDAYALFNMLYELTGKDRYKQALSVALAWLREVGYNRPEGRFMRGRGDSTIATDTFSWAIAAVGPQTLSENGMDPDGIMEFAENECKVTADFYRPDNRSIEVTGFDFAKASHLGRGGVVSTEWTAQMIVAFKIMADYYKGLGKIEKEKVYRLKAGYYLSQLGKMVISSLSPTGQGGGCLPYASIDNVDTGHGWRVAKGRRTGSVSATAYYIFALKGRNPLD